MHVLLQSLPPTLQQATSNPRLHQRLLDTHRQVSCGVTVPFSWVLVHKVLLCPPRVYFPVLCKFWQLHSGVNGNLLQEGLCHTHTQSPCPCGRPLPTCTSTGDAQTQFCLSLCGVPGFWCTRFCCVLQESISQSYVSSGRSIVGLMVTSSKRSYPHSEPLSLWQATANSYCQVSTGDTQTQFCLSLCGDRKSVV